MGRGDDNGDDGAPHAPLCDKWEEDTSEVGMDDDGDEEGEGNTEDKCCEEDGFAAAGLEGALEVDMEATFANRLTFGRDLVRQSAFTQQGVGIVCEHTAPEEVQKMIVHQFATFSSNRDSVHKAEATAHRSGVNGKAVKLVPDGRNNRVLPKKQKQAFPTSVSIMNITGRRISSSTETVRIASSPKRLCGSCCLSDDVRGEKGLC